MIRPPPIFTLFPYTTLFRSKFEGSFPASQPPLSRLIDLLAPGTIPPDAVIEMAPGLENMWQFIREWVSVNCHMFSRDRKSTRLNSSHLGISYAIFCLKIKIVTFSTGPIDSRCFLISPLEIMQLVGIQPRYRSADHYL